VKYSRIILGLVFFSFILQTSFHFWPSWSYIYGVRIDYLSPTLYLSDIFLFILLCFWFLKDGLKINFRYLFILFVFIILNLAFSKLFFVSLFWWVKILEFGLLSLYISKHKSISLELFRKVLPFGMLVVTFLALHQFLVGHSFDGVFWWFGERRMSTSTIGISLVNVFNQSHLRPYSLFPHPNALGGFSLVVLYFFFWLKDKKFLDYLTILTSLLLVIISFSQNVWLSLIFLFGLAILAKKDILNKKHINFLFWLVIIFSLMLPVISDYLINNFIFEQSIQRRFELAISTGKLISTNWVVGVGARGFLPALVGIKTGADWWIQPVHNIYLLFVSEMGIIIFVFVVIWINKLLVKLVENKNLQVLFCLLVILLTGFGDHYWLSLQQNMLLMSFIIGLTIDYGKN
jgi:hypothetical protein